MKLHTYCFLFILLVCFQVSMAQQTNTKPKPSATQTKTASPKKSSSTGGDLATGKFVLKLTSTADCNIKIDDESKGVLKAGELKKVYLSLGSYLITATSINNPADVLSEVYEVKSVNTQAIYNIDLNSKAQGRLKVEEAQKQKANCPRCHGTGQFTDYKTCPKCNGSGHTYTPCTDMLDSDGSLIASGCGGSGVCASCHGTGQRHFSGDNMTYSCYCHGSGKCRVCKGTGKQEHVCTEYGCYNGKIAFTATCVH